MFTVIYKGTSYTHRSRDVAMARLSAILVNHPTAIVAEDEATLFAPTAAPGATIVVERVFRVEFAP